MYGDTFHTIKSRAALNMPRVLNVLGLLLMVEAAFMLVPFLVSLAYGENDALPFAVGAAVTLLVGYVMKYHIKASDPILHRRDGCLLTATVWVAFSLMGMIPFLLCSTPLNVSESFFETMSGFTTTGATVIRDVEKCSHGILLWRALIQWLGGMGIVVFTLAIIPSLNNGGGLSMFNAEVSGITHDKIEARISNTTKYLWGIYALLTALLVILLWAGPMNLFDSVCHAMTTISTGGYSTRNAGIEAYGSTYTKVVITLFMFMGGVNFTLLIAAAKGAFRQMWRSDVFRFLLLLVVLYTFTIVMLNLSTHHFHDGVDGVVDPLFLVVSAMTSTGFSITGYENWGAAVILLTLLMMFVGASAGSTTGGAKLDRVLFLVKNFRYQVSRSVIPRLVRSVYIDNRVITTSQAEKLQAFLLIYTLLIVIGALALAGMGFPALDAVFASVSCGGNNGLGYGITGAAGSFDFVPAAGKWLMSLVMLAGRLEVFTLIVLLAPSFWRK